MTTKQDTRHDGWTNYATWCANNWLSDDRESYYAHKKRAGVHFEQAMREQPEGDRSKAFKVAQNRYADELQEQHQEQMPELPASVFSDLLQRSLHDVNWREIAGWAIADYEAPPI